MIVLITYGLLLGAVLVLAAGAAEAFGRNLGYSVRWVWIGAMTLSVGLAFAVPLRGRSVPTEMVTLGAPESRISARVPSSGESAWARGLRAVAHARARFHD